MKRKTKGVTRRTYRANVIRFSDLSISAWKGLNAFVKSNCKVGKRRQEEFMDALCDVVDRYVDLNCRILTWCHMCGIDPQIFVCDVMNRGLVAEEKA